MTRLEKAGVELRRVEAFEAPADPRSVVAAPGDFVLSNEGMRVVIGGLLREVGARGAVLEVSARRGAVPGTIALFRPTLYVNDVERPIRVERMFIRERAGVPTLRVEGAVLLEDRAIDVAREITLGRVPGTVSMITRVFSLNPAGEQGVRLGAHISWGGPRPFVPGKGSLDDENWHRADWVGGEGSQATAVFGFASSGLAARARFENRVGEKLMLGTDVAQDDTVDLVRGVPYYEKSALVIAPRGLASGVRNLGFWRGRPFPEAWFSLPYRPDGSTVHLYDAEQQPLLHGWPDVEGRVVLPLVPAKAEPVARYVAVATAYGHASSEARTFAAGERGPFTLHIPRGGRVRVRVRDSLTHAPLPVRIRFVPLENTPPPALGPDYRTAGAGDTWVALSGRADIGLPAGRYRALVTHGPEWSLWEQEFEVSETFSPLIDSELEHQVDPGNWVACDLHLHAEPSPDSEVTLEDRVASLEAEGIRFAVATDHNHVTDYRPARDALGLTQMAVETGVEVTTWEPNFGHFNAYPFPLDPERPGNGAPPHTGLEPATLFRMLREVGPDVVVQVNHPRSTGGIGYFDQMGFDPRTGAAEPAFSRAFDAIEVFNGFDLGQRANVDRVFDDWLALLASGQRVVATGSSDSHQVRYQLAGYPRTYAQVPELDHGDPRAIVRAIKAGATFVSSGPFLEVEVLGGGPGTTVSTTSGRASVSVRIRAPDWMPVELLEVFVGQERVITRDIPKPPKTPVRRARGQQRFVRFAQVLDVPTPTDTFVVVRVSSQETIQRFYGRWGVLPIAFSNPVFIDADGDGMTPWTPKPPAEETPGADAGQQDAAAAN